MAQNTEFPRTCRGGGGGGGGGGVFSLWFAKWEMSLKHTELASLGRIKNLLITNSVLFH